MMDVETIRRIVGECSYPGFELYVGLDDVRPYLQIRCDRSVCTATGEPRPWCGRKWLLSPHMTRTEVVQTALKAVLASVEHEAREHFRYKDQAIYSPHYCVDWLVSLCAGGHAADRRDEENFS